MNAKRYYANLKGQATDAAILEMRRLADGVYDLWGRQMETDDFTLRSNRLYDRELTPGKFLLVVGRQDTAGGRTLTFVSKFKGTKTQDLTPNSITVWLYWMANVGEAILVA